MYIIIIIANYLNRSIPIPVCNRILMNSTSGCTYLGGKLFKVVCHSD